MSRRARAAIDLSLGSVLVFTSLRNPNLTPEFRATDLPTTSPAPSIPLIQPSVTVCADMPGSSRYAAGLFGRPMSSDGDENDFPGIEEVTDTQWAAEFGDEQTQRRCARKEAEELEWEAQRIHEVQEKRLKRARLADPRPGRQAELRAIREKRKASPSPPLSSSQPQPSSGPGSSGTTRTPTALEPVTPHANASSPISWTPSPTSPRTKARKGDDDSDEDLRSPLKKPMGMSGKKKRVAVVLSESEEEVPLSTLTRNKGKGRARSPIFQSAMSPDPTEGSEAGDELFESNEGFEINEVYESNEAGGPDQWEDANDPNEDEYDRAFDTLNYAELDSIPTLQSSPRDNFVPVRSHDQPTSSRSPACSPSNHTYREPLTGLLDKEDSLVLVSMMDQRDQDFYRNHWRRADRGEGVGFEDLEVIGNKRKREAYPKRGGFRGRGRGRGGARARGRGKKR